MNIFSIIKQLINNVDIDSLYETITELDAEVRSLKTENIENSKEISNLKETIKRERNNCSKIKSKNNNEVDSLNRKIAMLKDELSRKDNEEIASLNNKIASLSEELSSERNKTIILTESQKKTSNKNSILQAKINEKDARIFGLQDEKENLFAEINLLQIELSDLKESKESLKEIIKNNEISAAKNILEIERLNSYIDTIGTELEEAQIKKEIIEENNIDLQNRIKEIQARKEILQEELNSLQNKYDAIKGKLADYENYINKNNEEKIELLEEIDSLKGKLFESIESNTSLKKIIEEKETYNAKNISEIERLNNIISTNCAELQEIRKNEELARGKVSEQENVIRENGLTIEDLQNQLCLEKQTKTSLQDKIKLLQSEKEILQAQIHSSQKKEDVINEELRNEEKGIEDKEDATEEITSETKKDSTSQIKEPDLYYEKQEENEESKLIVKEDIDIDETILDEGEPKTNIDEEQCSAREIFQQLEETEESNIREITRNDGIIDNEETQNLEKEEENLFKNNQLSIIDDPTLIPAEKLSIPEVYDVKEEKTIDSRDFFSQNENELILWRRNLQEEYLMGRARFICPECKQPVKISGHKLARGKVCYFAHFKDSDDCAYKTGTNRTKEEIERLKYSLVQESDRHKRLKEAISSALKDERSKIKGVKNVECEKRIKSDIPYLNWRRPDIYAEYNGRKFVFELQLTTTFVGVVVDRDIFYRLNNYNIIWIFNFEDNTEYVNLHNLMCKDIYYANKRNVFIFDADAEAHSKEKGELILKCRWLDENGEWSADQYVTLDDFQYDEENHKPFIIDADKAYLEKYPEYVERRQKLEHSREDILNALMERQRQAAELERRKTETCSNLQLELLNTNKSVSRFQSGTKYGFQYNGTTILPAKYTSAEDIREDGYAQVGFNKKIGLVRKDGKELVPVAYKNITVINGKHGIVMASYKRIDLWLADESFPLLDEYNDKEQRIVIERDNKTTRYILQTNRYGYWYTSGYYGPIRHKSSEGISSTILFYIVNENDFCIISINDKIYSLSKNNLFFISENYSNIKSVGIGQMLVAKDINTNLWGVIDSKGNVITDFEYEELIPTESEYLIAKYSKDSTRYGVIDYHGREFISPMYNALFYLNSGRYAFCENGLWGICDYLGNVLHAAEYTYIRGMYSDRIMGSKLETCATKWEVKNNIPSYIEENVKLCLLDGKGNVVFTEQEKGQYFIRHSGDLFSILTQDKEELVTYSLSEIVFIEEKIALIKDSEGIPGFFVDEKCVFFKGCKNIEQLSVDTFKFENINGDVAIGDYLGPVCDYIYNDIKNIDSNHYIASTKKQELWSSSLCYVIIDKGGNVLSVAFSRIDEFKDGFATAIYQGRKGIIDVNGVMQEEIVDNYGEYLLCVEFEDYYFRNKENDLISEKFQRVDNLFGLFFAVKKRLAENFKLYSLVENEMTDSEFVSVIHLTGDLFVVEKQGTGYYQGDYQLYKKLNLVSFENYFSIKLLDNGYIALQKRRDSGYGLKWIILKDDCSALNDMEFDSIIEVNNDSFKVTIDGNEGFVDLNGEAIVEKKLCSNGFVQTSCFADNGLEDSNGNVICALEEHFSSIEFMDENILKICKNGKYALYAINGSPITEHKFSSISYEGANRYMVFEDGIKGYVNSQGDYIATSIVSIAENGSEIFILREKYGLRSVDGNVILPAEYSSIKFIEGNLLMTCKDSKFALHSMDGNPITEHRFTLIAYEAENRYKVIEDKIKGHINSQGEYIETYKKIIAEDGTTIFVLRGKYGLRSATGNVIIPAEYTSIKYLVRRLLVVKNGSFVALFNFGGEPLTEFKYLSVSCDEEGTIHAKRNNHIGVLDDKGNELTEDKHFNGGCVKTSFGDCFVTNEMGEVVIPKGYSKIEILDDDGVLALWRINKVAIWKSKKTTKSMYASAKSIGSGFFVVSKTFSRKIREKKTRYVTSFFGWRTPQNYYTTKIIKSEKFGIIDMNLRTIIPCKYSSISNFDNEQNVIMIDSKNEKKIITLVELKNKSSVKIELPIEEENIAIVKSFMPIGLVVKIQETSYVIHKKYLFKSKQEFKKGESFIVKYLSDDQEGFPIWETRMILNEEQNSVEIGE